MDTCNYVSRAGVIFYADVNNPISGNAIGGCNLFFLKHSFPPFLGMSVCYIHHRPRYTVFSLHTYSFHPFTPLGIMLGCVNAHLAPKSISSDPQGQLLTTLRRGSEAGTFACMSSNEIGKGLGAGRTLDLVGFPMRPERWPRILTDMCMCARASCSGAKPSRCLVPPASKQAVGRPWASVARTRRPTPGRAQWRANKAYRIREDSQEAERRPQASGEGRRQGFQRQTRARRKVTSFQYNAFSLSKNMK